MIQNGFIPTLGMCKKLFDQRPVQCMYLCANDAGVIFLPKNDPKFLILVSPSASIFAASLLHLIGSPDIVSSNEVGGIEYNI